MISNIQSFRLQFYQFLTHRITTHVAFWLLILVILLLIDDSHTAFPLLLGEHIINIFFFATIVYFNLQYLIPNYLSKTKFWTYSGLLLVAAVAITPIRLLALYFLFSSHDNAQQEILDTFILQVIGTFSIASISTIIKIITDWARHMRERQELQTQNMQSELRFLKSQINPHFLFNTLNSLYALTLKKDDKAPEIIIRLSEMMRYMLYECNEKRVLLSKEVNYIRNYIALEQLRHGKSVDINFEVEGELLNQQVAPLMFIPFLENSFKHGVNHQLSKGFVRIQMNIDEQEVYFYIENSKADVLPQNPERRSGGIGLVNVRRRLNLLYPEHYDLSIDNNPQTYAVNLLLDLNVAPRV